MKLNKVNIGFGDILLFVVVSVVLTVFSLTLHIGNKDSMLYVDQLHSTLSFHKTDIAFKKRILTTELIERISSLFNFSRAMTFVMVNYGLTVLNGVILGCLSLIISKRIKVALLSLLAFYLSFPILFAYFHPVYTFDEPLQFAFLLGGAFFWINEQKVLSFVFLLLAVVTRETALIVVFFYPFLFNPKGRNESKKSVEGLILLIILIMIYLFYSRALDGAFTEDLLRRVNAISVNFQTIDKAIESLTSIFLVLGLPLTVLFSENVRPERLKHPILLAIIVNTLIVLFTANARESRLFILPILLLSPFLGELIESYFSMTWKFMINRMNKYLLAMLFIYIGFWFWFSFFIFDSSIGNSGGGLFDIYLFVYAVVLFPGVAKFLLRKGLFMKTQKSFNKN